MALRDQEGIWTQYLALAGLADKAFIEEWEKGLDALLVFVSLALHISRAGTAQLTEFGFH